MDKDKAFIFPALRYKNANAAIGWLEKAFGFERLMVVPGENGGVAHAELKIGAGVVMLGEGPDAGGSERSKDPSVGAGLYLYVPNVEAAFERAKGAGAEIVRELQDTDYGSREFSALDLEGNIWSFGSYVPEGMD
ncbi:MAG: VOC family protein [Dehalococcoidia bacterium]